MATIAEKLEAFDEKMNIMSAAFKEARKALNEKADAHWELADAYETFELRFAEQNAAAAFLEACMILTRTEMQIRRQMTNEIIEETNNAIVENGKEIEESSKDLNERLDALMQKQH